MSDENSEVDDLDDNSLINVELESVEALSTISYSSSPSQNNEYMLPETSHIVHQLFQREIGTSSRKTMQMRPPLKSFCLSKLFPHNVLNGQIFMGMTRCGRFLMTLSLQFIGIDDEWYGGYRYQLHWWHFQPIGPLKEIGKVSLFGNAKVYGPLQVFFCQWPKCNDKVLIYGLLREAKERSCPVPSNQTAYVTVTAIPPAGLCVACTSCSEPYMFDEAGSAKCLDHSFTVHTSFDIAVPYPEFQPKIHMRCEDFAVFNTNNVLHAVRVAVDRSGAIPDLRVESEDQMGLTVQVPPTPWCSAPSHLQEQIIRDFADDGSLTPKKDEEFESCLSPPMPTRVKTFLEHEAPHTSNTEPPHEFLTPRVFLKVKKCGGKPLGFRPFFTRRKGSLGMFLDTHARKSSPYEFVDDSQSEVEQLSQFRRKRLADKTYEFQECDAENILPFSLARQGPGRYPSRIQVLRPQNRNTLSPSRQSRSWEKMKLSSCSPTLPRIRIAEGDILVYDISGRYGDVEEDTRQHAALRRHAHCFRGTPARFTRVYYEDDEERASVVTDMEDDDGTTATGYHTLLNVEVHGSGYIELQKASPGAPVRPNSGCVRVEQQSLDIEAICQSVATSLCVVADKTFTFCNDYDVEVLDVCPRSGDVLVLLMMRIEAYEGQREEGKAVEKFEASVTLVWNLLQADYRITMVVPPQKMQWAWDEKATWNPAREASRRFRLNLPADITWADPAVRLCSNLSFIRDVMSVCSDDTDVLLLLPPDLFVVPDDWGPLPEPEHTQSVVAHLHELEERVNGIENNLLSGNMRRSGSIDTLTPTSRSCLRSRSLHNTPLKYMSPHKNMLTTESYIDQRERDTQCLREIDEYFKAKEASSDIESRRPVPKLDLQDFISKMEETERDISEKTNREGTTELSESSQEKNAETVRRSLNFDYPLKPLDPINNDLTNQTDYFKNQLTIKTDEPALQKDQLLSLQNLWGNVGVSKTTIYEELKILKQRLEEERFRRQHCEDLIRDLQTRLLESQEKIAVAFKVDEEKDVAIKKMKDGWARVVEQWKETESLKNELEKKLTEEKLKFDEEKEVMTISIKKYEQELLKSLDLVHKYNDKQQLAIKNKEALAVELSHTKKQIIEQQNLLKEKDEELKKSQVKIDELTVMCKDMKKQIKNYQVEKDRLCLEKESKALLQKTLDEALKRKRSLEEQLKSLEKTKADLKQYYQDQVESIVAEKQKDFQLQFEDAERKLLKQMEVKERALTDSAMQERNLLLEKHKLEVNLLHATHHEEIELYKIKLSECNNKIEDLQSMVNQQTQRQQDLAEKLYCVIQTQWKETLRLISSQSTDREIFDINPKKNTLRRQNTFTKDEDDYPATIQRVAATGKGCDEAGVMRRAGSLTYRINETPQKIPTQSASDAAQPPVKHYIEQLLQQRGFDDSTCSSLPLETSSYSFHTVNDASNGSKERIRHKNDKSSWK